MSKINTPPIGLQQLLGSQNFGDNPDDLLQQVRSVVDLIPFWGAQHMEVSRTEGGRSDEGIISSVPFFGPAMILAASARVSGGMTGAAPLSLGITISGISMRENQPPTEVLIAQSPGRETFPVGAEPGVDVLLPKPIVVEADTQVNSRWVSASGSSLDLVELAVLYYDLSP